MRLQGEAAGQVDPEAAVEARAPADRQRPVLSNPSPAKSKPSTPAAVWVKLPVMARGASVVICNGPLLITVPLPPLTEISSPSAVLPPAKVRFPAPIVIAPPVQLPNLLPDPPVTVTLV